MTEQQRAVIKSIWPEEEIIKIYTEESWTVGITNDDKVFVLCNNNDDTPNLYAQVVDGQRSTVLSPEQVMEMARLGLVIERIEGGGSICEIVGTVSSESDLPKNELSGNYYLAGYVW